MTTLEISLPEITPFRPSYNIINPTSQWLKALYEAMKPLSVYKLMNGKDAFIIWVRVGKASCQAVEIDQEYRKFEHEAESDSPFHGWWVMTIELHFPDDNPTANMIKFYSSNFNHPEIIRAKFAGILEHVRMQASTPTFDPKRIARALAVLAEE
jgi:hypothetical protein